MAERVAKVRRMLDGDCRGRFVGDGGGCCIGEVPEYILLSDEIGKWAGDIKKASQPDKFLADYVRVYDLVGKK